MIAEITGRACFFERNKGKDHHLKTTIAWPWLKFLSTQKHLPQSLLFLLSQELSQC